MNWKFWERGKPAEIEEHRYTIDDYAMWLNQFSFMGNVYGFGLGGGLKQTLAGDAEVSSYDFAGNARESFGGDAIVFACMAVRMNAFASIRFMWQGMSNGRPTNLFSTAEMDKLNVPWPGGTTQDLLNRVIQDADLAGNSYTIEDTPLPRIGGDGTELVRLRPDWMYVLYEDRINRRGRKIGYRKKGFAYYDGGINSGIDPAIYGVEEVAHFMPLPDPLANFRGMSWLTPVAREVWADKMMTKHKGKYFENGATPNMIIHFPIEVDLDTAKAFKKELEKENKGVENAYKRLYIGGGADATIVGSNMQEISFKEVQGAGETRIAAAAGVPAVVVGISEGMQGSTLNAGNYGQSRRRFADGTCHPLWANCAGSFTPLVAAPPGGPSRLWYDARDVPFLREDSQDAASISNQQMATITGYVKEGFTPESSVAAVMQQNPSLLIHTGMLSVQLQKPGDSAPSPQGNGKPPLPGPPNNKKILLPGKRVLSISSDGDTTIYELEHESAS